MAKASISQTKLFFALCKSAGFDSDEMKERAKKKLKLDSFKDITSKQISELIDKLQEEKPKEKHKHDFKLEAKSDKYQFFSCECGTIVIEPR